MSVSKLLWMFFLSESDTHEACPVGLGMLHAKAALANPESCVRCSLLLKLTLERRVGFLTKKLGNSTTARDPLLSEALGPITELESDELEGNTMGLSWGEQMDELLPMDDTDENLVTFDMQDMLFVGG